MSFKGTDTAKTLKEIDERERKLAIERALTLQKAIHSGDVDSIYKAQNYYNQFIARQMPQSPRSDGMKSVIMDPFDISSSLGYYHKATNVSFHSLRAMSRVPIIRAIINTRKDQVAEFCKPQEEKYAPGFKFFKEGIKDEDELSPADQKTIKMLNKFILNCGDDADKWDLDDFEVFIRKIVEDSLSLDQATFEIIPTRAFEPTQFVATDGATFRIADSYDNEKNTTGAKKVNGYYPSYVQVYQGNIVAEFYPWELCFGIRNPSTNIYANGYGRSELEDLITTVTSMINADSYNGKFFRHGSAPKGALLVKKGNINKDAIAQLRTDWNAMTSGVENMHKTPILDSESVEWLDMQKTNRDMEFSKFQEYLIKLACAVYKISPEEIGFTLQGSTGGGLGTKEGGKHEKKYSRDKGLKPLLVSIEGWINKFIIGPKTNNVWKFKFVGIDDETAQEEEERLQKAVTLYMTPDEVRVGKGMKPLPNGMGKMPLNPILAQMQQMQQQSQMDNQQKQQEQEQQDFENTNPFLDDDTDENPFAKAFETWALKQFVATA